jgi:hypothetical protein
MFPETDGEFAAAAIRTRRVAEAFPPLFRIVTVEPNAPTSVPTSPDEWGLATPLTHADALEAGRALGIDEELLAMGRAGGPAGNGSAGRREGVPA